MPLYVIKVRIYKACVLSVLLYPADTWSLLVGMKSESILSTSGANGIFWVFDGIILS